MTPKKYYNIWSGKIVIFSGQKRRRNTQWVCYECDLTGEKYERQKRSFKKNYRRWKM